MAHETTHDIYRQTNLPNESADYLSKREELRLAEIELMHQDLLTPVYNILDLIPQGRGDWYAELGYGIKVHAAR
jgi:predicted dithiol-disulfide oxidoreductase (DUF899 family)